ncbi:hypothetical protein C7B80_12955 [Cyanosarcina cf. burmensis CCALA 770]|nr:hypothetical protein C7B80_12955 [Cyanosarcina cf. burmensis CCALA 770]
MVQSFLQSQQSKAQIGNDAGWALKFYHQNEPYSELPVLKVEDYYADIQATLQSGLEGGTYTFVIEGLINDHYRKLKELVSREGPRWNAVIKLYLYWRDASSNIGGYLANVVGIADLVGGSSVPEEALVAELSIQSVSRKAGSRRYETTIQARERVFTALSSRIPEPIHEDNLQSVINTVKNNTGIRNITPHGLEEIGSLQAEAINFEQGNTYKQEFQQLANALEQATNKRGRGMLLIRDGILHVGVRSFPLEGDPKELTYASGLIEIESIGSMESDPNSDPADAPPRRPEFRLTLKGRPDIKPGDVVKVDLPPEDVIKTTPDFGDAILGMAGSLLPAIGGGLEKPVNLYVNSVQHRLGRTSGFSTVVTTVQIENLNQAWDEHSPSGSHPPVRVSSASSADSGTQAAQAVRQLAEGSASARRFADIGEVRSVQTSGRGSETEPPGQTLTTWRGLVAPDGRRNQANRLAIQRQQPSILQGIPYATPFAWGKCGLVVPRYPGTRVVVLHRNGQANDPLDVGALWEAGHGPDSQAGDWWLILPVDIPESDRATIANDATSEEHTGKVSQDLIDAEGNRIIEVGELTIRVGKNSLKDAGERPDRSDDEGSITIEHTKEGSKIVMKPDGSVEITAKKIKFDTSQSNGDIELDAGNGNITMKANSVDVQVSDSMNVH